MVKGIFFDAMTNAPKRTSDTKDASASKRTKYSGGGDSPVRRDLLERCYASVTTLREHVLVKLPSTSRLRRKKIASIGQNMDPSDAETRLANVLDTTLVCIHEPQTQSQDARWEQWVSFSQKADKSCVSASGGVSASIFSQSEIVDFVVWLLFAREKKAWNRPRHLLCDGFRKKSDTGNDGGTSIPDLYALYPNFHVKAVKEAPWPQLLALLGQSGEKMMIDLLLDHSIYTAVRAGFQNYHQLSGIPLSDHDLSANTSRLKVKAPSSIRKPADITLVRSRIFYARPALAATGQVQPGFKHIHVLNRCTYSNDTAGLDKQANAEERADTQRRNQANIIKVTMYMFPRQFGMHNVFTSQVDSARTAQKFQDYTLREDEIASLFKTKELESIDKLPKLPKRLRGHTQELVKSLLIRHRRCSYRALLQHYCPSVLDQNTVPRKTKAKGGSISARKHRRSQPALSAASQARAFAKTYITKQRQSSGTSTVAQNKSVVELAAPSSMVSAFCQAVMSKIIPNAFWGEGDIRMHNHRVFLYKVDHFVKLRRFEGMSLHDITQDMKIPNIHWLQPPGSEDQRPSKTDTAKRLEIFHEFLYYVFDSLLIPLIRSNFYVTESNTHRYQVFYFRHDVWRHIAEPSMTALKEDMFEEVKLDDAMRILGARKLGFSQIRLLPKREKLRPIMNLRRRALTAGPKKKLGPSINTVLGPIHTLMKLEKSINPSRLGSTLFSVSDIYSRLKAFKKSLGETIGRLYFAKLDVQAAFDTIPQAAVLKLMNSIPSQDQYIITKHAEVKPGERPIVEADKVTTSAIRRWHATALSDGHSSSFPERLEADLACKKQNTVFIDAAIQRAHSTSDLLKLLKEHVEQNLVKVGKKYYRQKKGIPQGSVLSSFLCNYFYADLELQRLKFLDNSDCLLLRLIDDFLLITLDERKAKRFVEVMHQGVPEYGVEVNPQKSLVNFDMSFRGDKLRKTEDGKQFPYCGTLIDCQTLEISKDRDKDKQLDISASLTVNFSRAPGQNFQRKVLNAFKIQSHLMFFDTSHNSHRTVVKSLREAFCETANKMWAYVHCLARSQQPSSSLIIRTIAKVVDVAFLLLTGKSRAMRYPEYYCGVRKSQVASIACIAFTDVLSRKQTKYHQVIKWLRDETQRLASGKPRKSMDHSEAGMIFDMSKCVV